MNRIPVIGLSLLGKLWGRGKCRRGRPAETFRDNDQTQLVGGSRDSLPQMICLIPDLHRATHPGYVVICSPDYNFGHAGRKRPKMDAEVQFSFSNPSDSLDFRIIQKSDGFSDNQIINKYGASPKPITDIVILTCG